MADNVIHGIDMDDPNTEEELKSKWGKEHSTVMEPNTLPKSDLEARLAIQKGVNIENLAVPKNGVAAYLPAEGSGSSQSGLRAQLDGVALTVSGFDGNMYVDSISFVLDDEENTQMLYVWDENAHGYIVQEQSDPGLE